MKNHYANFTTYYPGVQNWTNSDISKFIINIVIPSSTISIGFLCTAVLLTAIFLLWCGVAACMHAMRSCRMFVLRLHRRLSVVLFRTGRGCVRCFKKCYGDKAPSTAAYDAEDSPRDFAKATEGVAYDESNKQSESMMRQRGILQGRFLYVVKVLGAFFALGLFGVALAGLIIICQGTTTNTATDSNIIQKGWNQLQFLVSYITSVSLPLPKSLYLSLSLADGVLLNVCCRFWRALRNGQAGFRLWSKQQPI